MCPSENASLLPQLAVRLIDRDLCIQRIRMRAEAAVEGKLGLCLTRAVSTKFAHYSHCNASLAFLDLGKSECTHIRPVKLHSY